MTAWQKFNKVNEKQGKDAAWAWAQKNLSGLDLDSARRFCNPSAKDRRESAARQAAIGRVTQREINQNFQLAGLPRLGK